jgi:threo-3-hydroxy-L-aspartate ammonia-lyase
MVRLEDIQLARERISKYIKHTPLYPSSGFSHLCGNSIFLKLENVQNTNAFKVRGASNFLLQMNPSFGKQGVITASSGNHGKALAYVASKMGYPAKVVVPNNAPAVKVEAIQNFGAEVIHWGEFTKERDAKANQIAEKEGLTFVDSVDHPWIIAGQGTIGLEVAEDLADVEVILVPIGGGGLISGIAIAIKENNPKVKIFGVEPIGSNSMYLSIKEGKITERRNINTIADGLRSNQPGNLAFEIVEKYVDDILLVNDDDIVKAFKILLLEDKFLTEPSGAVALAALITGKFPCKNKKIVAIVSGGNIDIENIKKYL